MWYSDPNFGITPVEPDFCLRFLNRMPNQAKSQYFGGGISPKYQISYGETSLWMSGEELWAFQRICPNEVAMYFMDMGLFLAQDRLMESEILQHYQKYREL